MSAAQTLSPESSVPTGPGLLSMIVGPAGEVRSVAGTWAGVGRPTVASVTEFVHADDHEALLAATEWAATHGVVPHGVPVDVRGPSGWVPAVAALEHVATGVCVTFVPLVADPRPGVAADVFEGRRAEPTIARALETFAATSPQVWVSVHSTVDAAQRRRRVLCGPGQETFAAAVRAAALGDAAVLGGAVCPWDAPISEEPTAVDVDALPDGMRMAASHAGLRHATAIPVPAIVGDDAAVVMAWYDHPDALTAPGAGTAVERLVDALTLVFQMEATTDTLRHVATHDDLTGLWNRQALGAQIDQGRLGHTGAIVCLDLDDFADVNRRHGHLAGDGVLVELAGRLREVTRPGDFTSRVSGDQFALVCFDVTSEREATGIAERVLATAYQPFHVRREPISVRASVGVALGGPDRSGRILYDAAMRAMAEVKHESPGTWKLA